MMSVSRGSVVRHSRRITAVLIAIFVCTATAVAATTSGRARLGTTEGKLGEMLVGGNGYTLYAFTADKNGVSSCYGSCFQVWRPDFTSKKPTAVGGSGVNHGLLGTTRRKSGAYQATYNGHPLYFYVGDTQPGTMHGENLYQFGGSWYVVGPGGRVKKPVVFNPGAY